MRPSGKLWLMILSKVTKKVPDRYEMVSLDATSLVTNVPLEETSAIILKRIYDNKEIITDTSKQEMKKLLILCMKHIHYTFDEET